MLPRPASLCLRAAVRLFLAVVGLGLTLGGSTVQAQDDALIPAGIAGRRPGLESVLGPQGYAVVPLRATTRPHLEVIARINGVSGHFLVDTGAQITVVHTGSLAKFHLSAVKTGSAGVRRGRRTGRANPGRAGEPVADRAVRAVAVLAGRERPVRAQPRAAGKRPEQYDGIIGADVLQTFSFIVDCAGQQLLVWPQDKIRDKPGGDAGLGAYLRAHNYGEIPMKRASISDFEVPANVNGRKALWLVDTGAAITLLDRRISRLGRGGTAPHAVHGRRGGRRAAAHRGGHRGQPAVCRGAGALGLRGGVEHFAAQHGAGSRRVNRPSTGTWARTSCGSAGP